MTRKLTYLAAAVALIRAIGGGWQAPGRETR